MCDMHQDTNTHAFYAPSQFFWQPSAALQITQILCCVAMMMACHCELCGFTVDMWTCRAAVGGVIRSVNENNAVISLWSQLENCFCPLTVLCPGEDS